MRIGVTTDFYYPWIGGPAQLIRVLAEGLAKRGHVVSILAPDPNGGGEGEGNGDILVGQEPVEQAGYTINRARSMPFPIGHNLRVSHWPGADAAAWLDVFRPDVVHVHHPFPLSAAATFAARRRGIRVVATNHTIPECSLWGIRNRGAVYQVATSLFARWLVYLLSACQDVATPTETAAELLKQLGYTRPIQVISNGVDTARFSPGGADEDLRRDLGLDERPVVLYTGRLDAEKQMDVWLRAAAAVQPPHVAQLVIGGEGTVRRRLERSAKELGIDDDTRFIGYLPDGRYSKLFRLADVYCITSPVELQSIATMEAIASGLPVVAVRAGALPELVEDGGNGYIVRPCDQQAVAFALTVLLGDSEKRERMGRRSRQLAWHHDLTKTIDAYEDLLTSQPFASGRSSG